VADVAVGTAGRGCSANYSLSLAMRSAAWRAERSITTEAPASRATQSGALPGGGRFR
jgi:hypothetical protein